MGKEQELCNRKGLNSCIARALSLPQILACGCQKQCCQHIAAIRSADIETSFLGSWHNEQWTSKRTQYNVKLPEHMHTIKVIRCVLDTARCICGATLCSPGIMSRVCACDSKSVMKQMHSLCRQMPSLIPGLLPTAATPDTSTARDLMTLCHDV